MATRPGQVFPALPVPIGGGRILPVPAQFYVTGEDRLRVVSGSSEATFAIEIRLRMADFQGTTKAAGFRHVPNFDRTTKREDFDIGEGTLLNVTVFASAKTISIGRVYVMVQLVRGFGAAAVVLGTLLGGSVTSTQALGWPGSPIQSSTDGTGAYLIFEGTTPAAGADISETVPTGARWQVVSVLLQLTTSATVADRTPLLVFVQVSLTVAIAVCTGSIPASTTGVFTFAANLTPASGPAAVPRIQAQLPVDSTLLQGSSFSTFTVGLQAGDQYAAPRYVVREWLEVQ